MNPLVSGDPVLLLGSFVPICRWMGTVPVTLNYERFGRST